MPVVEEIQRKIKLEQKKKQIIVDVIVGIHGPKSVSTGKRSKLIEKYVTKPY